MMGIIGGAVALFVIWLVSRIVRIVPEQQAWIVEQLGKFRKALGPGLHIVVPGVQRVAYRQLLKEEVIDVRPQLCITKDNVQVTVDGILYLKVIDPYKASYGIDNYHYATERLAQTTMRSVIGQIELDNTFSERERINNAVVESVDEVSETWGIKVTRYEIKDIEPPGSVLNSMEQQMKAEREKRARILKSEGEKEARINVSKGEREQAINLSMAEKQKRINEADGKAAAIARIAEATGGGLKEIAASIEAPGGRGAMTMRIAEQYLEQLGALLTSAETSILPMEAAQIRSLIQGVLPAFGLPQARQAHEQILPGSAGEHHAHESHAKKTKGGQ